MHLLTAFSLKNRALIALVTIVAAVFGLLGVGSLKQELMPSVQFPAIAVVTSYPGASPEVVNKDVSGPIETALRGVPQLESTTATSSTNSSMVVAQFTYGVDLAATEQKVERAISRISQQLPDSADTQVLSGSIDDFPVIQIAVTPADGDTPEQTAATIDRIVTPEISDLDGVRDAQLSGARIERVTITPNADKLSEAGLTAQSITDALQQAGVLLAAGTVPDGDRTLAVQAGSEVSSPDEIAALPVPRSAAAIAQQQQQAAQQAQQAQAQQRQAEQAQDGEEAGPGAGQTGSGSTAQEQAAPAPGAVPTIGDLATVELAPGPLESISRVNGEAALTIAVTKMSAANTVDVSHAVQDKLAELEDQLGGAKLTVIFDQAPYVEQSIETLATEGLLGLLFAVLVILVFLMSVRATLVTAISIPTSVLLTFVGLNFAEYTLNMLTLGALTISIGRVVDDSIVVIENIKRHLVAGAERGATIVRAVREVAGAITASTVTTVAVFLPMAFVDGMVGELFRPFAFTVTIALAASLLVSLTIVPVLAYWFLKPEGARAKRRGKRSTETPAEESPAVPARVDAMEAARQADERPTAMQRAYRPIIDWTLKRPAITLLVAVVVFGATIAATPLMKTNFMGADEQNSVGLVQTLEPGTSLDAQLAQVKRVEDALKPVAGVDTVQVTIGSSGGGMGALFGGGGDGSISYSLTTDPDADQATVQDDIRAAVNGLDNAGEFSLGQSGGGVTMSSEIAISVAAPDQETLAKASDAVLAELKGKDELKDVQSDLARSRPFLAITIDRAEAAKLGLSEVAVGGQVARLMQPTQIGQIAIDADSVAVYLAAGAAPENIDGVAALKIQTAYGERRLDELAKVEVQDGPVAVTTADGVRTVTISALPQGDDLTTASAVVVSALESVKLPAGATAEIGGVMSQQTEAFEQLGIALLAAILIVYVVMVATFRSLLQPLLLLISVPFAATGALLLLIATGIPLGVASLIGVLMLVGIVVTNAIVLIDLVNQYRSRGDGLHDAVVHGSLQRLRPIVMTALATILALTPMGLGITGKGGFISQPLAVVVIGGLLSSTVLTLVVLPTLYYAVERGRERRRERRLARRAGGAAAAHGAHGLALAGAAGAGEVAGTAGSSRSAHGDEAAPEDRDESATADRGNAASAAEDLGRTLGASIDRDGTPEAGDGAPSIESDSAAADAAIGVAAAGATAAEVGGESEPDSSVADHRAVDLTDSSADDDTAADLGDAAEATADAATSAAPSAERDGAASASLDETGVPDAGVDADADLDPEVRGDHTPRGAEEDAQPAVPAEPADSAEGEAWEPHEPEVPTSADTETREEIRAALLRAGLASSATAPFGIAADTGSDAAGQAEAPQIGAPEADGSTADALGAAPSEEGSRGGGSETADSVGAGATEASAIVEAGAEGDAAEPADERGATPDRASSAAADADRPSGADEESAAVPFGAAEAEAPKVLPSWEELLWQASQETDEERQAEDGSGPDGSGADTSGNDELSDGPEPDKSH